MTLPLPLDTATLLRQKKSLRREWSNQSGLLEKRIAILGGSTTDEVTDMLELCLLARGIKPQLYQSAYNQYISEALQPSSALQSFQPDVIYFHTTSTNLLQYPSVTDGQHEVTAKHQQQIQHITALWDGIQKHFSSTIIQNNFELPWQRPLGNLDGSDYRGRSRYISQLNESLADTSQQYKGVLIHDIHYLSARTGLDNWFNPRQWYRYRYAMSMDAIVHLAWQLSGVIAGIFGLSKKCLALDLDNTLWGGVIGDDGVDGIALGAGTAEGEAHTDLQLYLKAMQERGILLSVCSKNDEANAQLGFTHPNSVLQTTDFSAFQANWHEKPDNIQHIANTLNITRDSIVFIDDNPIERARVKQRLPDVVIPITSDDICDFIQQLDRSALFETASLSNEDITRSTQYKENKHRLIEANHHGSYDDFLKSLQMQATVSPFLEKHWDRITQLTNKTNQFNLTTRRCTLADIRQMSSDPNRITLTAHLKDRFGDNGLVSVASGYINNQCLHIDLWLMSCRVLQRGLEYALLTVLQHYAKQHRLTAIIGYYLPTAKNHLAADFYQTSGFTLEETTAQHTVWRWNTVDGIPPPTHHIHLIHTT